MLYGVSFKYERRAKLYSWHLRGRKQLCVRKLRRTISEENPKPLKSFARLVPQIVRYVGNHRMFHDRKTFSMEISVCFSQTRIKRLREEIVPEMWGDVIVLK